MRFNPERKVYSSNTCFHTRCRNFVVQPYGLVWKWSCLANNYFIINIMFYFCGVLGRTDTIKSLKKNFFAFGLTSKSTSTPISLVISGRQDRSIRWCVIAIIISIRGHKYHVYWPSLWKLTLIIIRLKLLDLFTLPTLNRLKHFISWETAKLPAAFWLSRSLTTKIIYFQDYVQ